MEAFTSWINHIVFSLIYYPVQFACYICIICYVADSLGWYRFKLKIAKKDVPASVNETIGETASLFQNLNSMYKQVTAAVANTAATPEVAATPTPTAPPAQKLPPAGSNARIRK